MPHAFESVHNFDCLLFNFECFVKLPNDFELFPGWEHTHRITGAATKSSCQFGTTQTNIKTTHLSL